MTEEEYKNYKGQCKHCGNDIITKYLDSTKKQMIEHQACYICNFWLEKLEWMKHGNVTKEGERVIRSKNCHYVISNDTKTKFRGFGGQRFKFKLLSTGEIITTSNLWYQGEIPLLWRPILPDNAIQISEPESLTEATPSPSSEEGVSSI